MQDIEIRNNDGSRLMMVNVCGNAAVFTAYTRRELDPRRVATLITRAEVEEMLRRVECGEQVDDFQGVWPVRVQVWPIPEQELTSLSIYNGKSDMGVYGKVVSTELIQALRALLGRMPVAGAGEDDWGFFNAVEEAVLSGHVESPQTADQSARTIELLEKALEQMVRLKIENSKLVQELDLAHQN